MNKWSKEQYFLILEYEKNTQWELKSDYFRNCYDHESRFRKD